MSLRCIFGHNYQETHRGDSFIWDFSLNLERPAILKINTCTRCKKQQGFVHTDDKQYSKNPVYLLETGLVKPIQNKPVLNIVKDEV